MTTGTKLGSSLAVALAVIAALGIGAYLSTEQLLETNRGVVHTHQVIEKLESVLSTLKDAETGQRGFVLTGEKEYLEPYAAASGLLGREIDGLGSLVSDDPVQAGELEQVKALTAEKLAELRETIDLRKQSGMDAAAQVIRTGKGQKIMAGLRGAVARMQDREQRLLDARESASKASASRTITMVSIGTPLSLLVLAIFAMVVTARTGSRKLRGVPGDYRSHWIQIVLRYSFATVAVAVGTGLRLWLMRSFGPLPTFVTLYPAVLLVAAVAGGGPGVFASILSALAAAYFYLPPAGFRVDAPNDILALTIFTGTNLLLCVLMGQLRKAQWAEAVSTAQQEELDLLDRGTILALDPDHRIVRWSDGCRRLYGYGANEAVGCITHELFQMPVDEELEKARRILLEQGYWQGERVRRSKDGRELTIAVLWALRRDEKGQPHSIMELSADITDRKRAEEALRESEARFATTLASIGDAVIATDLDCGITFMNPEAEKLTGWPLPEALGTPIGQVFQIVNEYTRAGVESPVDKVLREGIVVGLANHTLLVRKDGTEVPIDDSGAPIKDANGNTTGVVLVFRDITERKQAEQAVRESEERLHFALSVSQTGAWDLDLVDHTAFRTIEHDRIFGYKALCAQWTYEMFLDHVLPEDRAEVDRKFQKALLEKGNWDFECRILRTDGEQRWIWACGRHSQDAQGSYRRLAGIVQDITARKQAEEVLRETERRNEFLADILKNASQPFAVGYPDGRLGMINPAYEQLIGYDADELRGVDWAATLTPPEWSEIERRELEVLHRTGQPVRYQKEYLRKDGTRVPIELLVHLVRDAEGAHDYYYSFLTDITDRRRAEEEILRSRALLQSIIDNSEALIYVKDLEGRLIIANQPLCSVTGMSVQDLLGKTSREFVADPEEGGRHVANDRRVIETGGPIIVEERSAGRTFISVKFPLRDAQGRIFAVGGISTDITERKRMEEALQRAHDDLEHRVRERTAELVQKNEENARTLDALRKSEQSLAEAQHIGHMGSWDWNFANDALIWSDELFRIFGLAPQSGPLDYARVLERIHPDDREHLEQCVDRALRGVEKYNAQYRIIMPDGGERVLKAQGEVELDGKGAPARMFGTVMDITEQVRAQEEAGLRQQQLVQADKLVSLGILTSGVAHEINNPNHSIMSNVTALSEVWDDVRPILDRFYDDFGDFVLGGFEYTECREKLPGMYANALAGSRKIDVIVNELRGFARNSPGERMAAVDVNMVVNSAQILMSSLVKKHTDRFSVELGEDVPLVTGNFQRMEQVIINLIQNACQALPDRDHAVTVTTSHDKPKGMVIVEVRDEGGGIAEENIKQMGTPFFTTKLGSEGMGLGLWISSNIVHEHGGTLTFTSKEGEGTRAVLSLPANG